MSERHIPLNALRVFRTAAEAGSFKQAAEQLFVTQAAVSQQIKVLETYIEQPLFLRLNREVVLTDAGRQLLSYVQRGLDTLEQGVRNLSNDPLPGTLRISALQSFSARWLVPKLGGFQQQHPEFAVQLEPSNAIASFGDGQLDLALRFGSGGYEGVYSEQLMPDYLLPLCSPRLLSDSIPALDQLQQLPMLYEKAQDLPDIYQQFQTRIGLPAESRNPPLTLDSASMLAEAVLAGQGFGLLRFSLVYELIERGLLCCPLPCYMESPLSYYIVMPHTYRRRPKIEAFSNWLRREIAGTEKAWQRYHQTELNGVPPLPATKGLKTSS